MLRKSLARPTAALAAAAFLVGACGGTGPTTAPTSAPTLAPATLAPTVAPATLAPASPAFTMPSVDKELEGLLPDEIAGETVSKSSVGGAAMVAGPGGEYLVPLLTALGKEPADLTAGVGSTSKAFFLAFRIKGLEASEFFDAFIDAAMDEPGAQLSDVTIAGKQAKKFTDSAGTRYLYFTGDTIITVSPIVASDAIINEIFQKLP